MADTIQIGGERRELVVRAARPEDRDPVLAFCAHTWDDGDYIESVWEDWLRDEYGALLVAVVGERPVALAHIQMVAPDEAWLEGMRVDPEVRRLGVGRVMTSRALAAARERGATVARLFTGSSNLASQHLVSALGFTRVAEIVPYEAPAITDTSNPAGSSADQMPEGSAGNVALPPGVQIATPHAEAFDRIRQWLAQPALAPFSGGLEFLGWSARTLSEPNLRAYLAAGHVWLLEQLGTIQAVAISEPLAADVDDPARLKVRYINGLAENIGRLAFVLRKVAGERDLNVVRLWLPDLPILRGAINAAGYTQQFSGTMWLYAHPLRDGEPLLS